MKTFREWLRETNTLTTDEKVQGIKDSFNIYESFDSHYDINKIYKNEAVNITFYEFNINKRKYRIFINTLGITSLLIGIINGYIGLILCMAYAGIMCITAKKRNELLDKWQALAMSLHWRLFD